MRIKKYFLFVAIFSVFGIVRAQVSEQFGMQFKPIINFQQFGTEDLAISDDTVSALVRQHFGYSLGMVYRINFTKLISFETGINLIRRNYSINTTEVAGGRTDFSSFGIMSYEVPAQLLIYIRLGEKLYMNASSGLGLNYYPSDIQSFGDNGRLTTLGLRKRRANFSFLANLGLEYRTKEKGFFYLGSSLVNPLGGIYDLRFKHYYGNKDYSEQSVLLNGNYVTLDFRYFFPIKER